MVKNFCWYGCYTFYKKEIRRFLITAHQTILGPISASLTMFFVLLLVTGEQKHWPIPPKDLMVCGLTMQMMLQGAFTNTSTSIIMAKVVGYLHDILFPPLSSGGLLIAYVAGATTRAIIAGSLLFFSLLPFTQISLFNVRFWVLIYFTLIACVTLALLGIINALISKDFEQSSVINSYTIMPLSFLSCTFYPLQNFPVKVQSIVLYNPFLYFIDGFRYSITGHADVSVSRGIVVTAIVVVITAIVTKKLFDKGYGLKQ